MVIPYRRLGQPIGPVFKCHRLKLGLTGYPERLQGITILRCVKSQNDADIINCVLTGIVRILIIRGTVLAFFWRV